jgi:hypothetical protein
MVSDQTETLSLLKMPSYEHCNELGGESEFLPRMIRTVRIYLFFLLAPDLRNHKR